MNRTARLMHDDLVWYVIRDTVQTVVCITLKTLLFHIQTVCFVNGVASLKPTC